MLMQVLLTIAKFETQILMNSYVRYVYSVHSVHTFDDIIIDLLGGVAN